MHQDPYRKARRVFWIVDNGSAHRGQHSICRLRERYPNLLLVHGPVHASRRNQIEIYISVLQRKALTPNDFASLEDLAVRLRSCERHYDANAKPFEWRFTRAALRQLLKRSQSPGPPCYQLAAWSNTTLGNLRNGVLSPLGTVCCFDSFPTTRRAGSRHRGRRESVSRHGRVCRKPHPVGIARGLGPILASAIADLPLLRNPRNRVFRFRLRILHPKANGASLHTASTGSTRPESSQDHRPSRRHRGPWLPQRVRAAGPALS